MEQVEHTSFSESLKALRKSKKVNQQQLAEKLDVHRNTIGAWERGDYLPESKGVVLEIARVLRLSEQETQSLLGASLTAIAPQWNVPYTRNPFFTGREEMLEHLHQMLNVEKTAAIVQSFSLSGLGGIGKTQAAVEYAYRHYQEYSALFWVAAETAETLVSSFVAIADLLKLPERSEQDEERIVKAVLRWLSEHRDWLLIFDNVEEIERVKRFVPAARQGSLLFTTRLQAFGSLAQSIELEQMPLEEGLSFLLRRARRADGALSEAEEAAARAIAEAMDGLPLALDQAGAFIEETQCSFADFLALFQSHTLQLLHERATHADHPLSIVRTLTLSFERVQRHNPGAAELLIACAFLAPDSIPEEIFTEGAAELGPVLQPVAADPLQFQRALKDLLGYSLLRRNAATKTLTVHRLVQAILKEQMSEDERRVWAERVVKAVNRVFPEVKDELYRLCVERYLLQARTSIYLIGYFRLLNSSAARLLQMMGSYLQLQYGRYSQAEVLLYQSLEMRLQLFGDQHSAVADSFEALTALRWAQGKLTEAEALCQKALAIQENHLGPSHPDVANILHCLAIIYREQGKYRQAEHLRKRVLTIQEQKFGRNHLDVANTLNSLAIIYHDQGKYNLAEDFYQQALVIREQIVGSEHPSFANSLNNLAELYKDWGRYAEAESLYQRNLSLLGQLVESSHPYISLTKFNLAGVYICMHRYEQALALYTESLVLREKVLNPGHYDIATSLCSIARVHFLQGQYEQAETFLVRALTIYENALGSEHPSTVKCLDLQANLYIKQHRYREAEGLFQRVLNTREQLFGSEHPDVASTLNGFAALRKAESENGEARKLYERALGIRERVLGVEHPETIEVREKYRALLEAVGEGSEAV